MVLNLNNMDLIELFTRIKKSFCELTTYKLRDDVLEVITAFSTLNNKFVSVFIKIDSQRIIVTDNGWIDSNAYETPIYDVSEEIVKRVISSYSFSYAIKNTVDNSGITYYYKTCDTIESLPSIVFDVANFIVGSVNSFCIHFKDEKEEKERETFRKEASNFLNMQYHDNVRFKIPLDDFINIKFNAIVNKGSNLFLISFVTGSTPYYFENDLRKTIVNFEIADKSKYRNNIKEMISIINNTSEGYQPEKSSSILSLLSEKTTKPPINWTNKKTILEYIN